MPDPTDNDHLVRATCAAANARGVACVTTDLVREACARHATLPTASVALGRALTAAALMTALLKDGQHVALKFEGNGPLGKIITEGDADGALRGYVANPEVNLPRTEAGVRVAPALGRAGLLTVRKDLGLKEPYSGTVMLYNSEIASDLAYYLTESEQLPSAVGLGVFLDGDGDVAMAGGFLIQSLPPSDPSRMAQLAEQAADLPPVSEFLLQGRTPTQLLEAAFGDLPLQALEARELRHQCSCSSERVEQALVTLGAAELSKMLAEDQAAQVACEFCRQNYAISAEGLQRLLQESH